MYIFLQNTVPTPANAANQGALSSRMSRIIARKKGSQTTQDNGLRTMAEKALDSYLSLPVIGLNEDTFSFWRNYSVTSDKAQKCLCELARHYLTPAPTSTGI